jgi:fructose-1,6-bisphosphatase/inositol monophosphatase family enzyme
MGATAQRPDVDRVTALLAEVVAEEVMPRFGRLRIDEIQAKANEHDPDDLVTDVDRRVEERLTRVLEALTPGVPVLGEEAAHAAPDRLRLVEQEGPLWLLDPIDGTRSFARGSDAFGVMLAYVHGGETRAAWVLLPARDRLFVAEAGAGAYADGRRVNVPVGPQHPPRGSFNMRYMPPAVGAAVARGAAGRHRPVTPAGCAAVEYTAVVEGAVDFVVYHRLLPWDHAPGALILEEAGGHVAQAGGLRYTPRAHDGVTVLAANAELADDIHRWW